MKIKLFNKDKGMSPPSGAFDFRPNRTVDSNPKLNNMKGDYMSPKNRRKRKYYVGGNFAKYISQYNQMNVDTPTTNIKLQEDDIFIPNRFFDDYKPKETTEPEYSVYWGEGVDEAPYDNLVDLLNAEGFKFRVTSDYRPGALTSKGTPSNHSFGDKQHPGAYDIVPLDGNFAAFRQALYTNPRVVNWLRTHDWGILEETTPEVKKQTKANGNHFHFGPDDWAKQMSEKAYKEFGV